MTKRKAPEDKLQVGRPSDYRDHYAEQARKLCLLGATDVEMAKFFCISQQTFYTWKHKHPEFLEALRAGKDQADAEIAEKLYHRARGYSHDAVKIFMPAGSDTPVYAPYTEHYPPDTQAASLWLRNRQPGKWRDKTEHELTGKDGVPLTPVLNVVIASPIVASPIGIASPDRPALTPPAGRGPANEGN